MRTAWPSIFAVPKLWPPNPRSDTSTPVRPKGRRGIKPAVVDAVLGAWAALAARRKAAPITAPALNTPALRRSLRRSWSNRATLAPLGLWTLARRDRFARRQAYQMRRNIGERQHQVHVVVANGVERH